MLRIAICCGEGFASGYLSRHLTESVVKENMQDEVSFIFIPFYELLERQDEVDVAMCLPHIEPQTKKAAAEGKFKIPVYIITYKVVIKPTARDYFEDAEDILALSGGKGGLYCFEGEERLITVKRLVSHRKHIAELEKAPPKKKGFGLWR